MRALLDVNVLIALLDSAHIHHREAMAWLGDNIQHGWASCPLTQIGCIRVMSQPAYPNRQPASGIADRLRGAAEDRHHEFWKADLDLLSTSSVDFAGVLTSRHVTDLYLLALASHRRGRFVTFDRHVPLTAVPSAQHRHLVVIGADGHK